MAGDVDVRELKTLAVSGDGSSFRMGVRDASGRDVGLVFPTDAVRTLMLSLFRVGDTAFKRVVNDDSARLVYPVDTCKLQSVPGADRLILVLATADGFEAAFYIDRETLASVASSALEHMQDNPEPRRSLN